MARSSTTEIANAASTYHAEVTVTSGPVVVVSLRRIGARGALYVERRIGARGARYVTGYSIV